MLHVNFSNLFAEIGKRGVKVCIENPIPHSYATALIGKYDQVIQPFMFGHPERKSTCLWLFNLAPLKESHNVRHVMRMLPKKLQQRLHYLPPGPNRSKLRSKTFYGIAQAMADQWG